MAFASLQTWKLIADFAQSHLIDRANSLVNPPAGYVGQIPAIVPLTSWEAAIDCYEDYTAATKASFGPTGGTYKAYIKLANYDDEPLEIGTVTVEQVGSTGNYYVVRLVVDDTDIPASYANHSCYLYITLDNTTSRWELGQIVNVVDARGTALTAEETKNIPISVTQITADTTPTAYPGLIVWEVNNAAAAKVITLPSAAAYAKQLIAVVPLSPTYNITLVGTINGDAGGVVLRGMSGGVLYSSGTAWYWMNADTYVTV
jgi:hypothetical protein